MKNIATSARKVLKQTVVDVISCVKVCVEEVNVNFYEICNFPQFCKKNNLFENDNG
jgi:hypothetical protein